MRLRELAKRIEELAQGSKPDLANPVSPQFTSLIDSNGLVTGPTSFRLREYEAQDVDQPAPFLDAAKSYLVSVVFLVDGGSDNGYISYSELAEDGVNYNEQPAASLVIPSTHPQGVSLYMPAGVDLAFSLNTAGIHLIGCSCAPLV